MKEEIKIIPTAQGYIPDEPDERDNIFGAGQTPDEEILPSGNWREVTTLNEHQSINGFETWGCVTFTILNGIEKLAKVIFGIEWNLAERFIYIASDTKQPGNSPKTVATAVREKGLVDEFVLPFNETILTYEQFNSPKPLTKALLDLGEQWKNEYEFRYDFLPRTGNVVSRETLRRAMKTGPCGIAVYAWVLDNDGKYIRPEGLADTHFTLAENVKENGEIECKDSYPPYEKTLSADFPIYTAMRFYLRKKTEAEKQVNRQRLTTFQAIISLISQTVSLISLQVANLFKEPAKPTPPPLDEVVPIKDIEPAPPKYLWSTPAEARRSARVIMDEHGLSWSQKDLLCACIQQESKFNPKAVSPLNKNGTRDWGLAQFNDGKNAQGVPYWIGSGAAFKDTDEVLNNPEKNVRIMIEQYKRGNLNYWASYSTGAYKQWL